MISQKDVSHLGINNSRNESKSIIKDKDTRLQDCSEKRQIVRD
jgi:hypothetical protein